MSDTKVRWDISDAIKKLNELAAKAEESADKIEKAFAQGSDKAIKELGKISPRAGHAAAAIKKLAVAFGPMAAVAGTAAAAVGSVVAQFVDVPELTRDATSTMEAYNNALERHLEIRNEISNFDDMQINEERRRRIRGLRLQMADAQEQQVEIDNRRARAKEALAIEKEKYDKIVEIAKKAADRRKQLEDKLADRTRSSAAAGIEAGKTKGGAVVDLAAAAKAAAGRGDVELAEELLDRAKELSEELGNHRFYTDQIASADEAINNNLRKQIGQVQNVEAAAMSKAEAAREELAAIEEVIKKENELYRIQTNRIKMISNNAKRVRADAQEQLEQQRADEGARIFQTGVQKFSLELTQGDRGTFQNFYDSFKQTISALGGIERRSLGIQGVEQGADVVSEIYKTLTKEGVTAGEVRELAPAIEQLSTIVGGMEVLLGKGTISSGYRQDFERLQRFLKGAQQALRGAGEFGAVRGKEAAIGERVKSPFDIYGNKLEKSGGQLQTLGNQANNAATALERISKVEAPQAVAQSTRKATATPAPQLAAAEARAPSTINVNANVKGGIIDAEVTREITRLIRTELRKQTLNSTA